LRWGLDGWLHCASGSHVASYGKNSKIKSHRTGEELALGSRDFRFKPATGEIEALSGPSQFGRNCNEWDDWFGVQNSFPLWHYVLEEKYLSRNPHLIAPDPREMLTKANPRVYPVSPIESRFHSHNQAGRFTSACSGMIYRDTALFPPSDISHAFSCEPVHNVIQHNHLQRQGVSFSLKRDAAGEETDFLASSDPWCRPVMARTGPDGALWVVDMYRAVIEHPQWLPQNGKDAVAPYLRAGDGRGRIYRVISKGEQARPIPKFHELSPVELVKLLDHSNGWVRDKAQRLLIDAAPADLSDALIATFKQAATPQGKLHALYLLSIRGELPEDLLVQGLSDATAPLRRHSLRLAEMIDRPSAKLASAIARLADDPSDAVRLQLACSLGEWDQPFATELLAQTLRRESKSRSIKTAAISSLNSKNIAAIAAEIGDLPFSDQSSQDLYREVMRMALAFNQTAPLVQALVEPSETIPNYAKKAIALELARHRWGTKPTRGPAQLSSAIIAAAPQSHSIAEAEDSPLWLRKLAIRSLSLHPETISADLELAENLLHPTVSQEIQQAVIRRLGESADPTCFDALLVSWSGFSPAIRQTAIEEFVSQAAWRAPLHQALCDRQLQVADFDLAMRQRLLDQPKGQAFDKVFGASNDSVKMVKIDQPLQLDKGNAQHGRQVFTKHCSSCHRYREEGNQVGPNLESLTNKTPANLLEAILAPNNAVEAKYRNYLAATIDGRVISGIITNESRHSVTLKRANGETTAVLREDIVELQATGKSLMPEGFDKNLSPQELTDLILYLLEDNRG
ncbi:MAG: PVC-type heme-binding CxxCH protein, partial [Blastopirellula sp. JB062]